MRARRPTALLSLLPVAGVLLLAGCTSDPEPGPAAPAPPSEADFADGGCAPVAAELVDVAALLPRLGDGGVVETAVKDDLRTAQDGLFAFAPTAGPAVVPALDDLVQTIGLVRIRADGNSYTSSLGEQLRTSYDRAVAACAAPAAASSPSSTPAPVIEVTLPPDLTESPGTAGSPAPVVSPSG